MRRHLIVVLAVLSLLGAIAGRAHAALIFSATGKERAGAPLEELDAGWRLFIQKGDLAGARARFEAAAKQAPGNVLVLFALSAVDLEQARPRAALQHCVEALSACPWGPHLEIMLEDALQLTRYAADTKTLEAALRKRLADKRVSWLEQDLVSRALARLWSRHNRRDEYLQCMDRLGFVREWLVLGPFNNRDKGGFDEKRPVEGKLPLIDLQGEYPGRGRAVKWFRARGNPDGLLDLRALLYPGNESLAYACVYVKCEQELDATLVLGTGGANMVWVDGALLAREQLYLGARPTQRLLPVKLRKGLNQVVVKVAGEAGRPFGLWLRILPLGPQELQQPGSAAAAAGKRVQYTVDTKEVSGYKPPAPARVAKVPAEVNGYAWGGMRFFDQVLRKKPYNMLALVGRGYFTLVYGLDDKKWTRARRLLDKAAKAWPRCPLALEVASVVQPGENEARELLQKAIKVSPQALSAREDLLQKLMQGGFLRQAEAEARALLRQQQSAVAWRTLGRVYVKREWEPEAAAAFKRALALAPGWSELYLDLAGVTTDQDEVIRILRKGRELAWSRKLEQALLTRLTARERLAEVASLRQDWLRRYPLAAGSWLHLAAARRRQGDAAAAAAALQTGLEWLPQSPFLRERLARLLLERGEKQQAMKLMRASLDLKSDNPGLADYLKQLEPKRKKFYKEHDIAFEQLAGRERTAKDYPRHNVLVLLDQGFVKVNPNGTTSKMIRSVKKILRRPGIRRNASYVIGYDPKRQRVEVIRARVIQEDGTVIDNPRISDSSWGGGGGPSMIYSGSYRVKSIRLPQIKVGSIIDLQYTLEDTKENVYADEFESGFFIGSENPTIRFEYTANLPAGMEFKYGQAGTDLKPARKITPDGRVELTWKARDLPGIEQEPRMPPMGELIPALRLSSFRDWAHVGRWVWDLSREQMELPADIKQQCLNLVKNCKTREEKIKAIYYYITDKIRYVSISYGKFGCKPHKAERTYRAGYGDCKDTAVLFCAMLKVVGVEARLALVRTYNLGRERTGIAGRGLFNHAIAYVPPRKPGGRHYWLDGTTDYFNFNELPAMDRDTVALVVGAGRAQRITIDPDRPENNIIAQKIEIDLAAGGEGRATIREERTGQFAPGMRRAFEAPERIKQNVERFLQARFPGSKMEEFKHSGSDVHRPGAWLSFKLTAPALASKEGGDMRINPGIFPSMLSRIYAAQKRRVQEMVIGNVYQNRKAVRVVLPPKATIVSLPRDLSLTHGFGSFTRKCKRTADGVRLEAIITIMVRRLPAKDYPAFKEFCNAVDNAMGECVVYRDSQEALEAAAEKKRAADANQRQREEVEEEAE